MFHHPTSALQGATVPPAQGGEITDAVLEATIAAAARATAGQLSDADGALLLLVAQPALEELLQHRRRADLIRDLLEPGNVLMFPGARG